MIKFEIKGLEELKRNLDRISDNAHKLPGTHKVPLSELLPESFMQNNTKFPSFDAMLNQSPFVVNSAGDFKAIP